tara:strand:- start:415 stop:867 length:453 start_codon:yes stop_codon:yes gene_type:complete
LIILSDTDFLIYTDGACLGNPGPGGWAALIFNKENKKKVITGSEKVTTNNRMELMAIIYALKPLKENSTVKIYSDSKYVINGINLWMKKWKENNWLTSNKKPVKNIDLWKQLDNESKKFKISWEWVKGHSGNIYNEEVDRLAYNKASNLD